MSSSLEPAKVREFLALERNEIVNFINGKDRTRPNELAEGAYYRLVEVLRKGLLLGNALEAPIDKTHIELANAIMEVLWCGWLTQAKVNRGRYTPDVPPKFEQIIHDAFKIGQSFANTRP